MNGRYLLDTNIVIALFANDPAVSEHMSAATDILIPSVVLGKLYYGAHKSSQIERNIVRLDEFASRSTIVACDAAVARRYGQVKDRLREQGHPIPENDIWIAAIALDQQLTLATRDDHFRYVDGLALQAW
jgi:tRNA(fMet)-specific endonuclease VapC